MTKKDFNKLVIGNVGSVVYLELWKMSKIFLCLSIIIIGLIIIF